MCNPKVDELSMMTYLSQFPNAKLKPGAPLRPKTNANRVRAFGPGRNTVFSLIYLIISLCIFMFYLKTIIYIIVYFLTLLYHNHPAVMTTTLTTATTIPPTNYQHHHHTHRPGEQGQQRGSSRQIHCRDVQCRQGRPRHRCHKPWWRHWEGLISFVFNAIFIVIVAFSLFGVLFCLIIVQNISLMLCHFCYCYNIYWVFECAVQTPGIYWERYL